MLVALKCWFIFHVGVSFSCGWFLFTLNKSPVFSGFARGHFHTWWPKGWEVKGTWSMNTCAYWFTGVVALMYIWWCLPHVNTWDRMLHHVSLCQYDKHMVQSYGVKGTPPIPCFCEKICQMLHDYMSAWLFSYPLSDLQMSIFQKNLGKLWHAYIESQTLGLFCATSHSAWLQL